MEDGKVVIKAKLDTKSFEKQIIYLEDKLKELEFEYDAIKNAKPFATQEQELLKLGKEIEVTKNKLLQYNKAQNKLDKAKLKEIENQFKSIGKETDNTIKKIERLTLGVFGIGSAYLAVRKAASTLSQYNEQIGKDFEYISYAIATTLQPVIEYLISLTYKLLQYVGYIAKAWFNIDIFANASAKGMNKASKSAESIKKSLAGFDEMNVLSDNTSSSSGGATPSVDLSKMQGEVPTWIKWIADNGDLLVAIIGGITTALVAMKFLGLDPILSLGIGLIVGGIVLLVEGIIEMIKDPSWENFSTILFGLGTILAGVTVIMLLFNAANPVAWIMLAIAAVVLLVAAIIKYWDEIKVILSKVWSWLDKNVVQPIYKLFKTMIDFFVGLFTTIYNSIKEIIENIIIKFKTCWENIKTIFGPVKEWFKRVFGDGFKAIIDVFKGLPDWFGTLWTKIKSKFTSLATITGNAISSALKVVINAMLSKAEDVINKPIQAINSLLGVINKVPGINLSKLTKITLPRLAVGGVINMPGKGVLTGGAIAGERGAEGVIPLTNSQMMAQLGEAIGKYITINASITNTMNGRVISKELKKIQNNANFAFNR